MVGILDVKSSATALHREIYFIHVSSIWLEMPPVAVVGYFNMTIKSIANRPLNPRLPTAPLVI
jgi:hypothetical protein